MLEQRPSVIGRALKADWPPGLRETAGGMAFGALPKTLAVETPGAEQQGVPLGTSGRP